MKLQHALDQFLQHLKYERNVSPHTLRNYQSDLEQFRDHLLKIEKREDIPVADIDRLTIREWMANLHDDHKKTSVARKIASLRTFFQFLIREGVVESNPAKMVATPKIERKIPNHLSMDEAVRFIETPDANTHLGRRDRAILEFLYATGIRVGELCGEHRFGQAFAQLGILVFGRNVDHANYGAALRRQHATMLQHGICRRDRRGAADRAPDVVVAVASAACDRVQRGRDAVFGNVRAAVGVDAGDDASHRRKGRRHMSLRLSDFTSRTGARGL